MDTAHDGATPHGHPTGTAPLPPQPGSLNEAETKDLDKNSQSKIRKTPGNMGHLGEKVLGMKTSSKLERGGEGNLRNKRYRSEGEKEMELRGDNWVIGNLTSVYENIPLIFIAQS